MQTETKTIRLASGIELSVRLAGRGPLVILMHGWPELGLSWRHQMAPLAQAGFTVAAPDMRGYGGSSRPERVEAYSLDQIADDMQGLAQALDAQRWVSVGHDWGSPAAWRCALRFPDHVAAIFSLSNAYTPAGTRSAAEAFEAGYPDRFYYGRYFQERGRPESELERDARDSLKRIFYALSGDAPKDAWLARRPKDGTLFDGLVDPPAGPLSFMTDAELDQYAEAYRRSGFFGPLSWYRNLDRNGVEARAYGDQRVRQPAGFLCGSQEIVLSMVPGGLEAQRAYCDDLRVVEILPDAGHWIQQERPGETTAILLKFLDGVRDRL